MAADFFVGPVIGEGSFGRVFYGKHKESKCEVAIKVMEKVSLRKRHAWMEAVKNEQKLLKELKGLNYVVNLLASFHDQECLYIVTDCAKGGTLLQLIDCRHSIEDWLVAAAHYGRQILDGLEEIHSRNVIHADLSPSNILVTERGRIKICDFGCAVQLVSDQEGAAVESCEAIARGTCEFASPEVLRAVHPQQLTIAVDIWSFGCILYCMVQGESPFRAKSEALAVDKILAFAREVNVSERLNLIFGDAPLSTDWQALVATMLDPIPSERIGNAKSQEEWHSWIANDIVWSGVDLDKDPSMLPVKPSWLVSDDQLVDGSGGWSVFLV